MSKGYKVDIKTKQSTFVCSRRAFLRGLNVLHAFKALKNTHTVDRRVSSSCSFFFIVVPG